jgi:hypothetical protein
VYSEEGWVDVGVSAENTVETKVDWSLEIVITDPLVEEDDARLLVLRVADGETVAVCPSERVVVNGSLDRVMVATSPFD